MACNDDGSSCLEVWIATQRWGKVMQLLKGEVRWGGALKKKNLRSEALMKYRTSHQY